MLSFFARNDGKAGRSKRRSYAPLAAITCLIMATAIPVQALVPVETPIQQDLLLPQGPEASLAVASRGGALSPAAVATTDNRLYAFTQSVGGRWTVLDWNPVTLTPHLVTGSGIDTGVSVTDERTAEALARNFIDGAGGLIGLSSQSLSVQSVRHGLGKWSVHFVQQLESLPVIGSRFSVTMTETGRIFAFGGDLWPSLSAPAQALLTDDRAQALVLADLQTRNAAPFALGARDRITTKVMGILPASETEGRLAYRIETFFYDPLGSWLVDVDARSGEILQIQNILRSADFSGTVTGEIEHPGWCFGINTLPVPHLQITIPVAGSDTTDGAGNFIIPYEGVDPESLNVILYGPNVDVNNTAGSDAHYVGLITPGEPYLLNWNDSNSQIDERDVFFHTNMVHDYVKWIDPSWADMDFPLPANVSLAAACNAFWDGGSINFYHEEGNCANTGRLGDVVDHEYGHGVTQYLYATYPPTDVSEANSDVIGNYIHNEPKMGRGFYLDDCENGIRNSDNDLIWPDDLVGEGHTDGQILAGVHWDLRQNMMVSLGEEAGHRRASEVWHFSRVLGQPMTQPEQVWWTFIADEDDGNMDNGTPNYDDICPAAEHHGFTCPERFDHVVIHHQAFMYVQAPGGGPVELLAQIYSFDGALNPDSLLVFYRTQGAPSFETVLMQPTAGENMYLGVVPDVSVGTHVEYYIFAADEFQNHLTDPRDAPTDLHNVLVVTAYDPFEQESGWTVGAAGDNATQGIWERCDPEGAQVGPRIVQPEDDATPDPGAMCWITGQYEEGYPWFSDADGRTTLTSPTYNLAGCDTARVYFHRWYQGLNSPNGHLDFDVRNNGGLWMNIHRVTGLQDPPAWTPVSVEISHLFVQPLGLVQFRMVMVGAAQPAIDEGGLDEFVLVAPTSGGGVDDDLTPVGPAPVALQLALASGNPLVGQSATIRFGLPEAGNAQLRVMDLSGRVVTTLYNGRLAAGMHEIAWSSRDGEGRAVASGVYFVQLVTPAGERSVRMLVAR